MIRAGALRWPLAAAALLFPIALAGNALLAVGLTRESLLPAVALAVLPLAALAFGALTAAHRHVLVFAALALNMTAAPLNRALVGPVYVADVLVALAIASWLASGLVGLREGRRLEWPDTPVLGWPFALFAVAIILAAARGHELYGAPFFGQPLRLVAYAAIAAAIVGTSSRTMYRGIVAIFYAGTVWMFLNAAYHLASGTSQTANFDISTGGTRTVSLTVSLYFAIALFLALLNLQVDDSVARRFLHVGIAALATFGTVVGYGRAVYIAVALLLPAVLIGIRRVRGAVAAIAPLVLPFLLIGLILLPQAAPEVGPTLIARVTASPADDRNVRFREEANSASLDLFRESPVIGVGFGREIRFDLDGKSYDLGQGTHNSLLWLLSGGGVLALGAFTLMCGAFFVDGWRRLRRSADPRERVLLTWSMVALPAIIIQAVSMQLITSPSALLTIWILLLLPVVVPHRPQIDRTAS